MGRTKAEKQQILEAAYTHFKSLYLPKSELFDYCRKVYQGKPHVVSGIIITVEHGTAARPCRAVFRIPPHMLENPKRYEKSDRTFERENGITSYGGTTEPDRGSEDYRVQQVLKNLDLVEPGLTNPRVKYRMRDSEGIGREIDLLCEGADGRLVVVEFKRSDVTPREIAAQTIEYMGMIIKRERRQDCVRGYMLVDRRYPAVEMAELVVANLRVKLYSEFPTSVGDGQL
jgi:hypothetical protein